MVPVNNLAGLKVSALVVSGIGIRPLMGFNQVGIDVYYDSQRPEIGPVVNAILAGNLSIITTDQTCGGGEDDCHNHE